MDEFNQTNGVFIRFINYLSFDLKAGFIKIQSLLFEREISRNRKTKTENEFAKDIKIT